jgi:LCP family protein required for cell wall assembly
MRKNTNGRKPKTNTILALWFLNLLLPGTAFLVAKNKVTGIIIPFFFLLTYAVLGSYYIKYGLQEVALTILSNSEYILYATYGLYSFIALYTITVLIGTFYLAKKAEFRKPSNIILILVTLIIVSLVTITGIWGGTTLNNIRSTLQTVLQEPLENPLAINSSGKSSEVKPLVVNNVKPWGNDNRINIMILGSDEGDDRVGVRPDILMVASVNIVNGSTQLFNIPRNLENFKFPAGTPASEEFPNGYDDLINSVWTWASDRPDLYPNNSNPGLQATQDALGATLGLDIEYSMVVNMQGFSDLVTSIGGVTVNVPRDLPKGKTGEINPPMLAAGQDKLLNGDDALWFVRSRADSNDYDRILRQRCMVSAITKELTGGQVIVILPSLLENLRDNFVTTFSQEDIKGWAELFNKVRNNQIQGYAFTEEIIDVQDPDLDFIKQTVQESIATSTTIVPEVPITSTPEEPLPTDQPVTEVQQPNPYC